MKPILFVLMLGLLVFGNPALAVNVSISPSTIPLADSLARLTAALQNHNLREFRQHQIKAVNLDSNIVSVVFENNCTADMTLDADVNDTDNGSEMQYMVSRYQKRCPQVME